MFHLQILKKHYLVLALHVIIQNFFNLETCWFKHNVINAIGLHEKTFITTFSQRVSMPQPQGRSVAYKVYSVIMNLKV